MKKLFDYPAEGWPSESRYNTADLIIALHGFANQYGIEAKISLGTILYFDGLAIIFQEEDYGSKLWVQIRDESQIDNKFFVFWKVIVDKGIVHGGPYKKPTAVSTQNAENSRLQKKRGKGTTKRNKRDQEMRDLLCEAAEQKNLSDASFMKVSINVVTYTLHPNPDYEDVMRLFEREYEIIHGEPPKQEMMVRDFVNSSSTLRDWRRSYKLRRHKP